MATLNALGRQILNVLRNKLIPWTSNGAPFLLLDAPPQQIGSNHIIEGPGSKLPLQRGIGQKVRSNHWSEEHLTSVNIPYMGCTIDGEADIVVGTTTAMCRKHKIPGKRWVIQAPQRSFFMVAPGVPHSGGQKAHWERPYPHESYSRILWMQFQATGVHCHFCTSDKGKHFTHPLYFIRGTSLLPLAENLISEMTEQSPQYLALVYLQLGTMFQLMVRNLLTQPSQNILNKSQILPSSAFDGADNLVQRVTNFIDQHLYQYTLTLDSIATHLQLSSRHLSRLFQQEMNMTVMQFVTQRRMEMACQLLSESQLNITSVAGYCGYASLPSFIKAFRSYSGTTPSLYRMMHKTDVLIG